MSSMKTRFIARIQRNLDAWRAGEIDFATFNECQRDTWAAIHAAGQDVEAEVMSALTGRALVADVGLLEDDEYRTVQLRTMSRPASRPDLRHYCGELQRTATGSPVLRVSPTGPGTYHAEHRQMAALVYELAADMERRSHQLEAHWTISPDAENGQVVIELAGDHETKLADEFVARVLFHHQLI
jgi:hypothetical protein